MRLLADENTHRIVVARLRQAGFDVEWIRESMPGADDSDILGRTDIGALVLVTNDRDFGELIFSKRLPTPYAILYSRLPHRLAELTADRLIAQLAAGVPAGQMMTLNNDGARMKPFPIGASHG